jgi:hypothetical protein
VEAAGVGRWDALVRTGKSRTAYSTAFTAKVAPASGVLFLTYTSQ